MHSGENAHRNFVAALAGNLFVHVEEIAVTLLHFLLAEPLDGAGEIEINTQSARADAAAFVANFFSGTRGNVARGEIAKTGVFAFEKIVAILFGNRAGRFRAI